MTDAGRVIEEVTERPKRLMSRPPDPSRYECVDLQAHDSVLSAAMAVTNAIARLINAAADSQQVIIAEGKESNNTQQFYKKHKRWTECLISTTRFVVFATSLLIESADGVISGTTSLEQLIVASNEVATAAAQLIAASRVRANLMSKTQEKSELAAKAVTDACRALVKQVEAVTAKQATTDRRRGLKQDGGPGVQGGGPGEAGRNPQAGEGPRGRSPQAGTDETCWVSSV